MSFNMSLHGVRSLRVVDFNPDNANQVSLVIQARDGEFLLTLFGMDIETADKLVQTLPHATDHVRYDVPTQLDQRRVAEADVPY